MPSLNQESGKLSFVVIQKGILLVRQLRQTQRQDNHHLPSTVVAAAYQPCFFSSCTPSQPAIPLGAMSLHPLQTVP
jgi:hypothetical protein